MLAADVLAHHNDVASTGENLAETVLTRSNVNVNTFGKLFSVPVDGPVYAQPLVQRSVSITAGPDAGVHDVVFVATEHDALYAIDAGTLNGADSPAAAGRVLWRRSFLDLANPANHLANATALTAVPQADIVSADITPEIGITGTPVIDAAAATLYVITKTKETVAGTAHYVQRLHAVRLADGTDRTAPFLIGDTTGTDANNTPVYVYSNNNGVGHVTDPYNGTGRQVVQFNALRGNQQAALTLVNGVVYAAWGSHGDNGPFHGWMVGFDKNTLALKGVLNTTPTGGLGGIWMGGAAITFDGTFFYAATGDGTFTPYNGAATNTNPTAPAPGPITGLNALGFPTDGNYADSVLKIALDSMTTPQSQNVNGWGLKVVDYFTPFNEEYLDRRAIEVGSAACVVLPDSFGSAAHPHLLLASGEDGVIYLIDRDNLGKFGLQNNIVQNVANQLNGAFGAPAVYKGRAYFADGFSGAAKTFTLANARLSAAPETRSLDAFSYPGPTPSVTANGLAAGIVWVVDHGTSQLRAYSSDSFAAELYNSDQRPGRDSLGPAVKFQGVTAANGHVYVASGDAAANSALVVYGLIPPPNAPPEAPSDLVGVPASTTQINLIWTDHSRAPNTADDFYVERSTNGSADWSEIAVAPATSYSVSGLAPGTTYYFRVRAHDALGFSDYAYTASATPDAGGVAIDDSGGFASADGLRLNGGATVGGGRLHLTTAATNQARSAFYNVPQNISAFGTTFTYTKNGAADGATFVLQRDPRGAAAVGGAGGSLGYGGATPITPSFALAINIYNGHPFGTEFLSNGTVDFKYSQTSIDTSLNDVPLTVAITYASGTLVARFTQGAATETKMLAVDLPALLGGDAAFVGFTGGTGSLTAVQDITNWTFVAALPPAAPSRPDLTDASDSGVSDADDITNDSTPTFTGIAAPGGTVTILVDGQSKGTGAVSAGGVYTVTTDALPDGGHVITAVAAATPGTVGASGSSAPLDVTVDTEGPRVISASIDGATVRELRYAFSEPVTALSLSDLELLNRGTSATVPGDSLRLSRGPDTATVTFPAFSAGALPAGDYRATLRGAGITDVAGNRLAADNAFDFTAVASVMARLVFYSGSAFDNGDAEPGIADDAAVATDKRALLPGQAASFANVTSYTRGVNGVMIDLAGLPQDTKPSTEDFDFGFDPGGTGAARPADAPAPLSVTLRRGAGAGGFDRVTIVWPDDSIRDTWVRVTLLASGHTGMAAPDVFYFGNLIGETGDSVTPRRVSALDLLAVRRNFRTAGADVENRFDINRDGRVNARDLVGVRANLNRTLATVPTSPAAPPQIIALGPTGTLRRVSDEPVLALNADQET